MGLAYEEYCDAMYEREYCMSDIDCGCTECDNKAKELEECYDGYQLFRNELEKIHDLYDIWDNSFEDRKSDTALLKIYEHILKLSTESGYDITQRYTKLRAVK